MEVNKIDFELVHSLSERDKAYLLNATQFKNFLSYDFQYESFEKVIENRSKTSVDRNLLHEVVSNQYKTVISSKKTLAHISNLKLDNTYTIITAHQPSLMTGPLYYIFKILSTIHLCKRLTIDFPHYNFVPTFIIGGEDHDFEEINHFYLYNKKIEWQAHSGGPVSRMPMEGITEIVHTLKDIIGASSEINELITQIESILPRCATYGEFCFQLTHLLMDAHGLVILNMDNSKFKNAFIPIIKDEIFLNSSKTLIEEQQNKIEAIGYKKQTHVRDINFFYLGTGDRKRIEFEDDKYKIIDTDLTFSKEELEIEIDQNPQNFSPNVIMRPLYQETILPNLAYIGGGGELAYWMERKTQFDYFKLPFPMLIRRNSAMIITDSQVNQMDNLGLNIENMFLPEEDLIKTYLGISDNPDYSLESYRLQIDTVFTHIEKQSDNIDSTISKTVQAEAAKVKKSIDYLESKLKKSIKQKEEVQLNRIKKLKEKLFPNGLQERHDNIFEYISNYGIEFIDQMIPYCDPFEKKFIIFHPK